MAWVRTVGEAEATGFVKTLYDTARRERGFVPNILKSMTIRPEVTRAWTGLHRALMFAPSDLTRAEREMIATVVSVANRCEY